jgi:hypothetical protein
MTDFDQFQKLAEKHFEEQKKSQKCCRNCGWFASHGEDKIGECRRYPPSFPALAELEWKHPRTSPDNICGEFVHVRTGDSFQSDPYRAVAVRLARAEEELDRLRRCGNVSES